MPGITLAWIIIGYGVISSSLPVWMLLAPRDYLSTFMKLGTIVALAAGILLVLPSLQMAALTPFTDGSGLVVADHRQEARHAAERLEVGGDVAGSPQHVGLTLDAQHRNRRFG